MIDGFLSDVPQFSVDWYRDIVDFADSTPASVQWFAAHFTEWSIILLGLLFVAAALPRLGAGPRSLALAVAAPVAVVLAYGGSELLKTVVDEERPCRTPADLVIVAGQCPPVGDWSFPSNHSTIAGALAAVILLLSPDSPGTRSHWPCWPRSPAPSSACTTRTMWPPACSSARWWPPSAPRCWPGRSRGCCAAGNAGPNARWPTPAGAADARTPVSGRGAG